MPHPESNHSTWLGATWTREMPEHGEGEGMQEGEVTPEIAQLLL